MRSTGEVIEVTPIRKAKRPEARAEDSAKTLGRFLSGVIAVQDTVDHLCASQEAQALRRQMGAARAEGGELPTHGRQIIEDAFD
jgi:hypothetical protein